jgi:hypothetical protein
MRDDEIEDPRKPEHPITAMLERLDSDEGFDTCEDEEEEDSTISRREVDALVDLIVGEELDRLNERKK